MRWTDVHEIAIALDETFPNIDPLTVSFVWLREQILNLPDFNDLPERCGERVLEAIQQSWIDERQ